MRENTIGKNKLTFDIDISIKYVKHRHVIYVDLI